MLDWIKSHIDEEDRFGASVTAGIHLLILLIALLYTVDFSADPRAAFIEVTLGEFRSGMVAERAEVQQEEVATRPNPPETPPEEPDPEITQPVETPQTPVEEAMKPVDLPDQTEEIEDDEVVETPETEIIEPEVEDVQEEIEEEVAPPEAQQDDEVQEGEEESGDPEGTGGEVNADEGNGQNPDLSAPYNLEWEGDLDRSPMVQPLPDNMTNEEATITIRFEVNPNGSLGRVIPMRKMNPELEREVMNTLRSWRFSQLPSGVPQDTQWGTITFRFVLE